MYVVSNQLHLAVRISIRLRAAESLGKQQTHLEPDRVKDLHTWSSRMVDYCSGAAAVELLTLGSDRLDNICGVRNVVGIGTRCETERTRDRTCIQGGAKGLLSANPIACTDHNTHGDLSKHPRGFHIQHEERWEIERARRAPVVKVCQLETCRSQSLSSRHPPTPPGARGLEHWLRPYNSSSQRLR